MTNAQNPNYWIEKLAGRKTGYPAATVAYYGPTDRFASKVVVCIFFAELHDDVDLMKRWFCEGEDDVRRSLRIHGAILEFLQENRVERVLMLDRIIGCPHEEGIDYPEGGVCPECPFWASRDRWTGEIISP